MCKPNWRLKLIVIVLGKSRLQALWTKEELPTKTIAALLGKCSLESPFLLVTGDLIFTLDMTSLVAQMLKNLPAKQETQVRSLD